MRTIRLTIEYDGGAYSGWQFQANGLSVQEVVEGALAIVVGEKVRLISSGRTDAGVHARGMVAHFLTCRDLPLSAFREGVNRLLPRDVAIRTSWHIRSALDFNAMKAGAEALVGTHDFAAFRSSGCDARTTVRTIFSVEMSREGDLLHIDVKGSGFLRNMVRVMVGTLMEIGMGKRPALEVEQLLREGCRTRAGQTAPPCGLCLMEVWY
jgi:tRNA pseudouridine38-40 synthase